MRLITSICLILAAFAGSSMAAGVHDFTDPTEINVLERWDVETGTMAVTVEQAPGYNKSAEGLPGYRSYWRYNPIDADTPRTVRGKFTFAPGTPQIGQIDFSMKNADHAGDEFEITDDSGLIADETNAGVTWAASYGGAGGTHYTGASIPLTSPRDSDYIQFATTITKEIEDPAGSGNYRGTTRHGHHMNEMEIWAAAGQQVQVEDSGYNIFYDSAIRNYAMSNVERSSRVNSSMTDSWLDADAGFGAKQPGVNGPADLPDSIIVPFEEEWNFAAARGALWEIGRAHV